MHKLIALVTCIAFVCLAKYTESQEVKPDSEVTIHPGKYKQTLWGISF